MKRLLAVVLILGLCVQGYADTIPAFANIANGDTSDAPTLMTNFNSLRDNQNGNINNVNIKALAGIVESKLNLNALALTNLIEGGEMEVWHNGAAVQPTGWTDVSTPTVARDTALQGQGSYALKITGVGAVDEGSSQTITNLKISTVYRVSASVKVTSGDTASITTTGATTNMDEDSTTASWTTVTGTFTTDGSGTDVVIQLLAQNDTDVVWFDNVIVTEGTARVGFIPNPLMPGGNVGIGKAPVSIYSLLVAQPDDTDYPAKFEATYASAVTTNVYFSTDGNHTNARGILIQCGEDVEAGTNQWLLAVDGDGGLTGGLRSIAGTFDVYDTSDERLKKNIKKTKIKGKDIVMGIKVRDYEKKNNPGHVVRAGLVAQELLEVFPEAVGDPDPATGMYAISRGILIPPMIKHMQEMQKQIEDLTKRIEALEGN